MTNLAIVEAYQHVIYSITNESKINFELMKHQSKTVEVKSAYLRNSRIATKTNKVMKVLPQFLSRHEIW